MRCPLRLGAALVALILAGPGPAIAETWVIDPEHTVSGFTVRHMMIANVTGVFEMTRGTIEYVPGEPGSVKADVAVETKSVNTRHSRRDNDLRSDNFLNAERFAVITFKSKRVQNVKAESFQLVGDLTIRDVTREVVLDVTGPSPPIRDWQGKRRVGATASTVIKRQDWGVSWNRALETGGVLVGDEVKINIEVEAVEKKGQ